MNDLIVTPAEMRARAYAQFGACRNGDCTGLAVCDGLCYDCAELERQSQYLQEWEAAQLARRRRWYEDPGEVALVLFVGGMVLVIAYSMAPWFAQCVELWRHLLPWGM